MVSVGAAAATGLDEIDREECYRLLPAVSVGRVVFTDRALPAIQPVNFAIDGEEIVFRTTDGSKLSAIGHTVVAFEVDEFDTCARVGWSVVVVGRCYEVTDGFERARILDLPLDSFAPDAHDRIIRIAPSIVTGRRIGAVVS